MLGNSLKTVFGFITDATKKFNGFNKESVYDDLTNIFLYSFLEDNSKFKRSNDRLFISESDKLFSELVYEVFGKKNDEIKSTLVKYNMRDLGLCYIEYNNKEKYVDIGYCIFNLNGKYRVKRVRHPEFNLAFLEDLEKNNGVLTEEELQDFLRFHGLWVLRKLGFEKDNKLKDNLQQ